ncbi:MAG TPA: GNAT family N-acetyltransferase [Afifellaceae bacterium]|nr:GNAT family N-acetyltransferase [Afifellaceae bacterium]
MLPVDAPVLAAMFRASIEALAAEDYSEAQLAAWAEAAEDIDAFARRLAEALTIVATLAGEPVGFASLKEEKIDMLFVDPDFAGQGVGSRLCEALEKLAANRGVATLSVDASDNALPFFQRRGFTARTRNSVPRGGEWLGNTTMQKALPADPPAARPS